MEEASAVAHACGVSLPQRTRYDIFDGIVASGAARNKTSMCRDIESKRRTERDAIYMSVIQGGRQHGIETPTLDTLYALVEGVEFRQTR